MIKDKLAESGATLTIVENNTHQADGDIDKGINEQKKVCFVFGVIVIFFC